MTKTVPQPSTASWPLESESVSMDVVQAVADAEGVSPLDLDPLVSAIDPDALESLVASMDTSWDESMSTVRFPYAGYDVVVGADASVRVRPRDD